jgi:hypothetical protein
MSIRNERMLHAIALHLSILLHRAKLGASEQAVRAYLDAGGSPDVLLQNEEDHMPLLHYMALGSEHPHTELAECVRLLIDSSCC